MIRGVMTMSNSFRDSTSWSYLKSQPRTGISETYGTPRLIFSFVEVRSPPSMTVSPSRALIAVIVWIVSIDFDLMTSLPCE